MIYFVRHGQTDYNLKRLRTGFTDIPLNETGFAQAKETAEKLKDIKFDECYCSPLVRARQTCDEILKYHSELVPIFDERLKEGGFGILEGTPFDDNQINERKFGKDGELVKKYGLESLEHILERLSDFYNEYNLKNSEKNILIVAHGGIAMVSNIYFYGVPDDGDMSNFKIKNADIINFD